MAEESQTGTALHFLDYWRVVRDRKEVILAVALLTIVTGTAYTLMMPNKYTATTQLEVREDAMDVDPFYDRQASRIGYNPFFLMTQEKIMRSRPVLMEVIRNLNLQRVWGAELNEDKSPIVPELALRILSRSLRVEQDRDTTLMNISVTTEDETVGRNRQWDRQCLPRPAVERETPGNQGDRTTAQQVRKQQEQVGGGGRTRAHPPERCASSAGAMGRVEATRLNMLETNALARGDAGAQGPHGPAGRLEGEKLMDEAPTSCRSHRWHSPAVDRQPGQPATHAQNGVMGENPDVMRLKGAMEAASPAQFRLTGSRRAAGRLGGRENCGLMGAARIKASDIESEAENYLPFDRADNVAAADILTALRARTVTGIEVRVPRTGVEGDRGG